ncbi:unnamed protein product [Kuraishia capsulata CBS 1993]|uniref:Enolase-phosphatase E1 n=1 Tax=Kuraishia capsulata CBS 1993 TaxID=1382522 RepID=W6MY33_9ASCO|nr:uncharacterized protein KUCA_T00005929001 [Kuraishia capsulata CBS 1993]CDK29935.1 unnamed protein product [Kuraishia capsulata CBS 1993]
MTEIQNYLLDIEGTVCPITFVKDELFPFFLKALPSLLSKYQYPLQHNDSDAALQTLSKFPEDLTESYDKILAHLNDLVARDIKDPLLKQLQGLVWQAGYDSGEIKCPVYEDAIIAINRWTSEGKKVFIYSSGSVKAQKLLFGHTLENGKSVDLNPLISGYFDTLNAGMKNETTSYTKILEETGLTAENVLFLSDNVNEVRAAFDSGMHSIIVCRPGNAELSEDDRNKFKSIDDFSGLV